MFDDLRRQWRGRQRQKKEDRYIQKRQQRNGEYAERLKEDAARHRGTPQEAVDFAVLGSEYFNNGQYRLAAVAYERAAGIAERFPKTEQNAARYWENARKARKHLNETGGGALESTVGVIIIGALTVLVFVFLPSSVTGGVIGSSLSQGSLLSILILIGVLALIGWVIYYIIKSFYRFSRKVRVSSRILRRRHRS
jgi:hypothetical protein